MKNMITKSNVKKVVCVVALTLLMAAPAKATIYLDDEDMSESWATWLNTMDTLNPLRDINGEKATFAPIGNGILLATLLGGFYLVNKRKKEEE